MPIKFNQGDPNTDINDTIRQSWKCPGAITMFHINKSLYSTLTSLCNTISKIILPVKNLFCVTYISKNRRQNYIIVDSIHKTDAIIILIFIIETDFNF